jgi:hypothetical protein
MKKKRSKAGQKIKVQPAAKNRQAAAKQIREAVLKLAKGAK